MFLGKGQLFDQNFHEWKIIPLYLFRKVFRIFKFHSNLDISKSPNTIFLLFYQEILMGWSKYFFFPTCIPETITSQFLWFNKIIKIDGKCIYFEEFSMNELNFVGNIKPWVKNKGDRSSHQRYFLETGVLKSFTKFIDKKPVSESLS